MKHKIEVSGNYENYQNLQTGFHWNIRVFFYLLVLIRIRSNILKPFSIFRSTTFAGSTFLKLDSFLQKIYWDYLTDFSSLVFTDSNSLIENYASSALYVTIEHSQTVLKPLFLVIVERRAQKIFLWKQNTQRSQTCHSWASSTKQNFIITSDCKVELRSTILICRSILKYVI